MTVDEALERYPYVAGTHPWDYPRGTLAMIQGVPDEGYRRALATLYIAWEPGWLEEEVKQRARELRRQAAARAPQSREHLDHWTEGT